MKQYLFAGVLALTLLGGCGVPATPSTTAGQTATADAARSGMTMAAETTAVQPPLSPAEIAVQLDLMRGHLLVSAALIDAGDYGSAYVHASHPSTELYFKIEPQVRAADKELDAQTTELLKRHMENVQAKRPVANIAQDRTAVQGVLDQIEAKLVPNSKEIAPQVVATLLNTAMAEYGEGVVDGKVVQAVEYQDAVGFTRQAQHRFDAIKRGLDANAAQTLATALATFGTATKSATPPQQPVAPDMLAQAAETLQLIGFIGGGDPVALRTDLQALISGPLPEIIAAAKAGNRDQAKQNFTDLEDTWFNIEDGVRVRSITSYRAIEAALNDLQDAAVRADTLDAAVVQQKGAALQGALETFTATVK